RDAGHDVRLHRSDRAPVARRVGGCGTDRVRPSRGLPRPPGRSLARAAGAVPDQGPAEADRRRELAPRTSARVRAARHHPRRLSVPQRAVRERPTTARRRRAGLGAVHHRRPAGRPWLGARALDGSRRRVAAQRLLRNRQPGAGRADQGGTRRALRGSVWPCGSGPAVLRGPRAVQARLHRRRLLLPPHQGRQRHRAARRLRVDRAQAHRDRLLDHRRRARLMAWGMTVPLDGVTLDRHPELYRELADMGYTDLWSTESNGADGFTPLALAAAAEPRLRLGTAIVSSFTRGPALLAQSAATMAAAAPGRFVLGLGASSDVIVRRWDDIPVRHAYPRTTE